MARRSKRDLTTPLAPSGDFDPADYNKDGKVTPKEQKRYNKQQKSKAKGEAQVKKIKEKSNISSEEKQRKKVQTAKNIASVAAGVLGTANQVKNLLKNK